MFCPPVATFSNARHATEKDIYEGTALSVELDSYAQHGLETLEAILGPATIVVRSGGRDIDEEGAQHDKLHAHWRLAVPAMGAEELEELKQARALATRLPAAIPAISRSCIHPLAGELAPQGEPRSARSSSTVPITKSILVLR